MNPQENPLLLDPVALAYFHPTTGLALISLSKCYLTSYRMSLSQTTGTIVGCPQRPEMNSPGYNASTLAPTPAEAGSPERARA